MLPYLQVRHPDGSCVELVNGCRTDAWIRRPTDGLPRPDRTWTVQVFDCDECCCPTFDRTDGESVKHTWDLTAVLPGTPVSVTVDGVDVFDDVPAEWTSVVWQTAEQAATDLHTLTGLRWAADGPLTLCLLTPADATGGDVTTTLGAAGPSTAPQPAWPHPTDPLEPACWYDGSCASGEFFGFAPTADELPWIRVTQGISANPSDLKTQRARECLVPRQIELRLSSIVGTSRAKRFAENLLAEAFRPSCTTPGCRGVDILLWPDCPPPIPDCDPTPTVGDTCAVPPAAAAVDQPAMDTLATSGSTWANTPTAAGEAYDLRGFEFDCETCGHVSRDDCTAACAAPALCEPVCLTLNASIESDGAPGTSGVVVTDPDTGIVRTWTGAAGDSTIELCCTVEELNRFTFTLAQATHDGTNPVAAEWTVEWVWASDHKAGGPLILRDVGLAAAIEDVTPVGLDECAGGDYVIRLEAQDPHAYRTQQNGCTIDIDPDIDLADCEWNLACPDEPETELVEQTFQRCDLPVQLGHDEQWCAVGWDPADYPVWPPIDENGEPCRFVISELIPFEPATAEGCCEFAVDIIWDGATLTWEPVNFDPADYPDTGGLPCEDCPIIIRTIWTPTPDDPGVLARSDPPSGSLCCEAQMNASGTVTPLAQVGQIPWDPAAVDPNGDPAFPDPACTYQLTAPPCDTGTVIEQPTVCTASRLCAVEILEPVPGTTGGPWTYGVQTQDPAAVFPDPECVYQVTGSFLPDTYTALVERPIPAGRFCGTPPGCPDEPVAVVPAGAATDCGWCEPLKVCWECCELPPEPGLGDRVIDITVEAADQWPTQSTRLFLFEKVDGFPPPDTPDGRSFYGPGCPVEPAAVAEITWIPECGALHISGVTGEATISCAGQTGPAARNLFGPSQTLWVDPTLCNDRSYYLCVAVNPWYPPARIAAVTHVRELA